MNKESQKVLLEYIDWKESYFYKQLIVRHVEDGIKWDKDKLLNDDEVEFLMKMIKNYRQ